MRTPPPWAALITIGMAIALVTAADASPRKGTKPAPRAAIDLGSSSFKILVTNRRGAVVHDEKVSVGLGAGAEAKRLLLAPKTQLATETLARFIGIAKRFGVAPSQIAVIATAAIRNAKGPQSALTRQQGMMTGRAFMRQQVRGQLGLKRAKVLSGDQEALLGFQGALIGLEVAPQDRLAVLDTGGGSHQLTVGTPTKIEAEGSTQVGANTVTERIFTNPDGTVMEQVSAAQFAAADAKLAALVPALPIAASHLANTRLVAIGGTAKYLAAYVGAPRITRAQLDELRHRLGGMSHRARAAASVLDAAGKRFPPAQLRLLGLNGASQDEVVGAKLPAKLSLLLRLMDLAGVSSLELSTTDARHALVQP